MQKILRNLVLVIFVSFAQSAYATNETEDMSLISNSNPTETSILTKKQIIDNDGVEIYSSNLEMKKNKIFGFGLTSGGAAGLIGIHSEINIRPADVVFLGMGAGKGYNTFNFGYKFNFESAYLSPYTKVGFSKWFSSSSSSSESGAARNSDLLKNVLSDNEISENKFNINFITASAGLEYNQLEGELSGLNFFGEVSLLSQISQVKVIPTGALGITYFY